MKLPVKIPPDRRLQASKVKPKTLEMYSEAVESFLAWAHRSKLQTHTHNLADNNICRYLHKLCEDGATYTEASYTVFGWILLKSRDHIPDKMKLPVSRQALKGWKSRYPGKSKAGIDLALWDLIALACCRQKQFLVACGILIQGDTYLRPSELFELTADHLIPPRQNHSKKSWGLMVGLFETGVPTKAGEFDDCVILNTPSRMDVNQVVAGLSKCRQIKGDHILYPLTVAQYNRQIKLAAEKVGLGHLNLSAHFLRHSGPSHDIYHGLRSLQEVQLRGRWKAPNSVSRYRKPGRMLLQQKGLSKSLWRKAEKARPQVIQSIVKFFANGFQ